VQKEQFSVIQGNLDIEKIFSVTHVLLECATGGSGRHDGGSARSDGYILY
jgi:hypothetical protein